MIQPAPGQILVQPSPVDTAERRSQTGLFIVSEQPVPVHRGIVLRVCEGLEEFTAWDIADGDVVYYLRGIRLGEVEFVELCCTNVLGWDRG